MEQGFSARELAALERVTAAQRARPGALLFDVGNTDAEELILLEGELELRSADGVRRTIRGGEAQAMMPLARLRPRQFRAKALTPIRFLRVTKSLLSDALSGRTPVAASDDGYEVVELLHGEDDDAQALFMQFAGAVATDEICLPSLPTVAVQVREAVGAKVGAKELSRIINIDGSIAAKVMRSANSPMYRGEQPCATVGEAVTRIGAEKTQQLVLTFALREVFTSDAPALKLRMRTLWRHTQRIAGGAFLMARSLNYPHAEGALLAGLLHEIGAVAILAYAEDYPQVWRDTETLERVLAELKGESGMMVLSRWGFDATIARLPRDIDDWQRDVRTFDHCALLQLIHFCDGGGEVPQRALELAGVSVEQLQAHWTAAQPNLKALQSLLGDAA